MEFTYRNQKFPEAEMTTLLASASQDRTVRVWHIREQSITSKSTEEGDGTDSILGLGSTLGLNMDIFTADQLIKVDNRQFRVGLETLLSGHEDWVQGAKWKPPKEGTYDQSK